MKSLVTRSNRPTRARLALERLEQRETPAGNVNISFSSNAFVFAGDNDPAGNQIKITATANNHFLIEGLNGTTLTIAGVINNATSIDTSVLSGFSFSNNGATSFRATFGSGNDSIEFDGAVNNLAARLFGDATINMGAGDDTVVVTQASFRNMLINAGVNTGASTDNDSVSISAGGTVGFVPIDGSIRGRLIVNGGLGADIISLSATVGNSAAISLRGSGHTVTVNGSSKIGGNLAINASAVASASVGTNTVTISDGVRVGGRLDINNLVNAINLSVNDLSVGGHLNVRAGGNATAGSSITLDNTRVGLNANVSTSVGANVFATTNLIVGGNLAVNVGTTGALATHAMVNTQVGGNLSVNLRGGDNVLELTNIRVGNNLHVNARASGATSVSLEDSIIGRNMVLLTASAGSLLTGDLISNTSIGGNAFVNYGSGNNTLTVSANTNVHGSLSVNSGAGVDAVTLSDADIDGRLHLNLGAGNDVVAVTNLDVRGVAALNLSGGNDILNISGNSIFHSRALINVGGSGADDDIVDINANVAEEIAFLGGVSLGTGAGVDVITAGTAAGKVSVMNGLLHLDATDTLNFGANLLLL